MLAVKRLGQDAGRAGLAYATGSGQQKGMGNPFPLNGILQGAADMLLSGQFGKGLGAIFTGKNFVGQGLTSA
jgi:hypothetical protein